MKTGTGQNIGFPEHCAVSIDAFKGRSSFYTVPLRRLKVAILKFSLMYLVNNVHAATSRIQLPLPLKTAASSNLFIYRLEEVAGLKITATSSYLFTNRLEEVAVFRGSGSSISLSFQNSTYFHNCSLQKRQGKWQLQNRHF